VFQVFHICDGGRKISFLCPDGTTFRQSHLICDWWFRVDCGKSVELYEESAEQLAADQKVYKERADEREKRKKSLISEPQVYALDEPYQKPTDSIRQNNSGERKSERNSKRVKNADFSNMYPGRQGKSIENIQERSEAQPAYNDRRGKSSATTPNSIITFTQRPRLESSEKFQQAASGNIASSYRQNTHHVLAVDKNLFASRRPTTASTTALPTTQREERERQLLAESANFASHRNGKAFSDFQNAQLLDNSYNKFITTTQKPISNQYTVTSKIISKSVEMSSALNNDRHQKFRKTEERLKYVPFSSQAPVYKPTIPTIKLTTSTTPGTPYPSSPSRVPVDNVYFTTIEPEASAAPASSKAYTTPNATDVALSLQELNIRKTNPPTTSSKPFIDEHRDGLQVPPSSGPGALRSFALYFSDDGTTPRNTPFLSNNILVIPIRRNTGNKPANQVNVLQQVEDLVKESGASTTVEPLASSPNLPNSLTNQTKDSYNSLFGSEPKNNDDTLTTVLDSFTESPGTINSALQGNDLTGSQSRGLVEPDPKTNQIEDKYSRVAPDLRELAQVFTKALSAYLDDPEGFRKVLSEIRPTEPAPLPEEISSSPLEYPSATQEEDEVLDFSDVTKSPKKNKGPTEVYRETTTEPYEESTTTQPQEISNFVLPLSSGLNTSETRYHVPDFELRAPLESLDQSQSSYYTPSPNAVGTTNSIAEEINKEFSVPDKLPDINSNEALDSYATVYGSVDDQSRPRYGGFQNNSYSPYGSELTSTTTTTTTPSPAPSFNSNRTSRLLGKLKEEEIPLRESEEQRLFEAVNNLATSPSFSKLPTTTTTTQSFPTTLSPLQQEPNPAEINIELSPPFETEPPNGFFVTYTLVNGELQTKIPTTTTHSDFFTTVTTEATNYPTERITSQPEQTETYLPTTYSESYYRTTQGFTTFPPTPPTTTTTTLRPVQTRTSRRRGKTLDHSSSMNRIMELQETLMFNTTDVTPIEKEEAKEMVQEAMSNMTMTDMTATTLTKMMELAAKNETYRRLVLLLVNDRSGRNKSVEEARLSLLRALLTPVISQRRNHHRFTASSTTTEVPITTRKPHFRRGKTLDTSAEREMLRTAQTQRRVTTSSPEEVSFKTTIRPRVVKTTTTTTTTTTTVKPSTVIGNLGLIRKTLEESKSKEVRINSIDDAILDSDARAIELLRSLYSLAARWG